jgi:hypothetical protein
MAFFAKNPIKRGFQAENWQKAAGGAGFPHSRTSGKPAAHQFTRRFVHATWSAGGSPASSMLCDTRAGRPRSFCRCLKKALQKPAVLGFI